MSGPDAFPPGGVRALLETAFVTEPTRRALRSKLDRPTQPPRFFDPNQFATLQAVCDRLIPQSPRSVDIAGGLDERLADNKRDGWRYDVLPPDQEAYRRGLAGVDQSARALFGAGFTELPEADQDDVLRSVADGHPPGAVWIAMSAGHWFEELLVEASEIFFAHPLTQETMGYLGMADAQGWRATGLDQEERTTAASDHAAA
jgi:hypothetical protein